MRFCSSDDEGSEEDEEEEEHDEQLDDEEEQEEDDDDYHEVEEEQEENGFAKNTPSKPEVVSGLSNMMAKFDFNVNSPFNFGSPSTTETQTKTNRWSTLQNLDKMKEHLKVIPNDSIRKKPDASFF